MAGSAGKDERERLDAGGLAASIATLLFSLPALGMQLIFKQSDVGCVIAGVVCSAASESCATR